MHITITDQITGDKSIMCVERDAHTGIILVTEEDKLQKLVSIAKAMKLPHVITISDTAEATEILCAQGWQIVPGAVILKKVLNGT